LSNLEELCAPRRNEFRDVIAREVQPAIIDAGIEARNLGEAVVAYCSAFAEVLPIQAQNYPRAFPELDDRRTAFASKAKVWTQALMSAREAVDAEGIGALLALPVTTIKEAVSAIAASHRFMRVLEIDLKSSEERLVANGDPDLLVGEIRDALGDIAGTPPASSSNVALGDSA
jgi:hypothetical protein